MTATEKPVRRLSVSHSLFAQQHLFLLKVTMLSMLSMGALFGVYVVQSSSSLVLLVWLVFIFSSAYTTKEFLRYARASKRSLRHCLHDTKIERAHR